MIFIIQIIAINDLAIDIDDNDNSIDSNTYESDGNNNMMMIKVS